MLGPALLPPSCSKMASASWGSKFCPTSSLVAMLPTGTYPASKAALKLRLPLDQ